VEIAQQKVEVAQQKVEDAQQKVEDAQKIRAARGNGSTSIALEFTVPELLQIVALCALAAAWARVGARPAGWLGSAEQWCLLVGVLVLAFDDVAAAESKGLVSLSAMLGREISGASASYAVSVIAGLLVAIGAGTS